METTGLLAVCPGIPPYGHASVTALQFWTEDLAPSNAQQLLINWLSIQPSFANDSAQHMEHLICRNAIQSLCDHFKDCL